MRLLKIPLIILVILLALTGLSLAQGSSYLVCGSIDESSVDTVRQNLFRGVPGDTVWAPFYMASDSAVTGFKMLITWDDTYLTPCIQTAPGVNGLIVNKLEGRFLNIDSSKTDPYTGDKLYDTTTDFSAQLSLNPFDEGAILAAYNLGIPADSVPKATAPGEGIIFRLAFEVDSTMPHKAQAEFGFHEVNEFYIDTATGFPVYLDCRRTELALAFNDGTVTSYPTLISTYFEADTAYKPTPQPVINTFYASPTNVVAGGKSTLFWDVDSATSVSITGVGTVAISGQADVFPTVTTTYTLTAVNLDKQASRSVTVTVGTTPDNNNPVISLTPNQSVYEIEQGETVSFTVTATDIDNDVITLSATSLPNNATFTQVIGAGTVSSGFSFTPDITQIGTYSAIFGATDNRGGSASPRSVSIVVTEIEQDRLFTTSAPGQAPVGGIPGKTSIFMPINLVTAQTVFGIQYDFSYNYLLFDVDSILVTTRTPDYVVYDNIGATPGQIRVVAFGLANEPIITDDTTTAVLYTVMSIDPSATAGDYPVYIDNGWESVNPDPDYPSLPLLTDSGVIQVDRYGDVNLDKMVNVGDMVNVVAYIIGNFGLSGRQFDVADVVINSVVDVFDLVAIINYVVFATPFSPSPAQTLEGEIAKVSLDYDDVSAGGSDLMVVRSELPVEIAGVELEIAYDPKAVVMDDPLPTADVDKLTLTYRDNGTGKMKVLLYYNAKDLISIGLADLVQIPINAKSNIVAGDKSQIRLSKALLSTSSAQAVQVDGVDAPLPSTFVLYQNYPNPFNPTTTVEFSLSAAADVRLDIYNILGQRVTTLLDEKLPSGSHRVVWDATNGDGQRVATGVYLYKLQVDSDKETKKMMFLK
ncbi:MAG: T9SS type A sorting domain-containing protein [candidate division Zixibacteria bacterium]|nr:T9SS type A sorting domain-containing protein [candidate division Zixibacteria bacterium]